MTHRAVAYVSTAVAGRTPADLDRLLIDARAHNRMEGVTGVLLHDGHRFFQYFEGPPAGVEKIYARIRDSRMHVGLQELQISAAALNDVAGQPRVQFSQVGPDIKVTIVTGE